MKEATVCTRIVNGINEAGAWAFKIPDAPTSGNFTRAKGFDIIASIEGTPVAIEVKINKSLPAKFSTVYNMLTPSQKKHLPAFQYNGKGKSFIVLCVFKPHRKVSMRRHELYVIPWGRNMSKQYEKHKKPLAFYKDRYDLDEFLSSFPQF